MSSCASVQLIGFLFSFQGLFFTVPFATALALAFLILHTTGWNVYNTLGFTSSLAMLTR